MSTSRLTPEQAEKLRLAVAKRLRFFNRLEKRLQQLGFPPDDPVMFAASRARAHVQDLHVAAHYASCRRGVGRAETKGGSQ